MLPSESRMASVKSLVKKLNELLPNTASTLQTLHSAVRSTCLFRETSVAVAEPLAVALILGDYGVKERISRINGHCWRLFGRIVRAVRSVHGFCNSHPRFRKRLPVGAAKPCKPALLFGLRSVNWFNQLSTEILTSR